MNNAISLLSTIGGRVRLARTNARMTLHDLAWRTLIHWQIIDNIEHGDVAPTADTLEKIAQYTHVSVDWLTNGPKTEDNPETNARQYCLEDILTACRAYVNTDETELTIIVNFVAELTGIPVSKLGEML